jgi:hypothetical protein
MQTDQPTATERTISAITTALMETNAGASESFAALAFVLITAAYMTGISREALEKAIASSVDNIYNTAADSTH